jgi:DNA-binding NarL/FixJ family response regulator
MSSVGVTMTSVLLADNHLFVRGGLRALLQGARRGFHVCGEASDGYDAVDLALQKQPDVVIININLPGINGIEATRRICRNAPATQVLIFTTEDSEDLMREALCAGARGYLLKSASDKQIIEAIETLAAKQAYRSTFMDEKLFDKLINQTHGNGGGARLTGREQEILRLVARGHRNKAIAAMLGISVKTVDTHRAAAMRKLSLRSTAEVVHYAIREKLIQA